MGNTRDLSNRINESYSRLSKGQKLLATYITDNYDKAVFLTAARLGEVVGVSESTVVRFATHLGYKGYPEFQNALEELVRNKLNSIQRMEVTYGRISQSKILESVLHSDADKINTTLEKIDQEAFEIAVNTILNAKHIYIIGIRSCAPLASFMAFYFNLMFDNVHLLQTSSSSEIFEQMVRIGKDDVIIGISFPRYSMRTLKAMEFANNRNAKVITLTDSVHSPMNLYSSCNLIADSDMASIVDSLVAPLSVINALIVALCMKNRKKVAKTLEMLEDIWDEYQVYESDEINYIDDSIVYFSENMLHLIQEGKASTINNSNYILFEFPLNAMPMNIEDVLYSLLEHKYIPILAHPERYVFTQKNPNLIYDLANEGVLMQANYGSILGKYGKKAQIVMEKMLQNNLVNFLGTDAHRCKSVYTHLKPAINKINSIVGRKYTL